MNKSQVDVDALIALATHKEIPLEQLISEIEAGVLEAYYQTLEPKRQARATIDRETGEISVLVPTFNEIGERISEDRDEPEGFARTVNSTVRQVIKLKMRATNDAEIVVEFSGSVGDVISGVVQQGRDPKMINVNLGRVKDVFLHKNKYQVSSINTVIALNASLLKLSKG